MKEILSKNAIEKSLSSAFKVEVFDVVPSTNTIAKECAKSGKTNFIIVSRSQTAGRGRFTRRFISPMDCGIYFSVVITPKSSEEISFITPLCAVACCKAIRALTRKNAQIKWVNDVYVDGKKCAGILCEGVSSERAEIDRIVMGIGVNIVEKDGGVDEEIKDIAGYIGEVSPNELLSSIVNEMTAMLADFDKNYIAKQYKALSFLIGKKVVVSKCEDAIDGVATVEDIDDECRLNVRYEDGQRESLAMGEVRIKI